jgi:hypothetical protein
MLDAATTKVKPMPLDAAGFNPDAYVPTPSPAYTERWTPHDKGHVRQPRPNFVPRSDADALLHIWQMMATRWARRYSDGNGNRCIVGWIGTTCEPTTVDDCKTPQVVRLMQRLHNALPPSAQRKSVEHRFVLARFNDTRSLPAIRAWVMRAYIAELNSRIDSLNRPNA